MLSPSPGQQGEHPQVGKVRTAEHRVQDQVPGGHQEPVQQAEPQGGHQHDHAVALQLHPAAVPPVRQKHGQHLRAVQRREGDEVEDAQADVQADEQGEEGQRQAQPRALPLPLGHGEEHTINDRRHIRQHKVRGRPRQGGDGHALLGLFEIPWVHRHGLGPAEAHRDHHDQAKGVQVAQGVQREPVALLGGGVTQMIGRQAMADLMDHQAQQNGRDAQDHLPHAGPIHPLGQL